MIPLLAVKNGLKESELFIIKNVKFGTASSKGSTGELDSIICTRIPFPDRFVGVKPRSSFCKVLAVVEIKRNPDDIGEAFVSYQKSLAWLGGWTSTYAAEEWKTKTHPSGHFGDKPFMIVRGDEIMAFAVESFSHFRRRDITLNCISDLESLASHPTSDCNRPIPLVNSSNTCQYSLFIDDLYFVAKPSSLDGVSSKASSWLLSKISTNEQFDMELQDDDALESLRQGLFEKYPQRLSSIELLKIYNDLSLSYQIYLVGKGS